MNLDEILIIFVPPLLGIVISFFTKSRVSTRLLRHGGIYFSLAFCFAWVLSNDCGFSDFAFSKCNRLPQIFGDLYSMPHLVNFALYTFVAPFLLMVAIGFEVYSKVPQKKTMTSHRAKGS